MIGSVMMCTSVVLFLLGICGGIAMGIQHDFTLGPAHAHLNLIGGVMMFLFGLYYRLVPAATGRLAVVQGGLHMAGAVLFPLGIALSITQGPAYMAVPVVGSLVVTAAVALFGFILLRTVRADTQPGRRAASPADHRHGPLPASRPQPFHGIVQHSDSSGAGRRQNLRTDFQSHGQG